MDRLVIYQYSLMKKNFEKFCEENPDSDKQFNAHKRNVLAMMWNFRNIVKDKIDLYTRRYDFKSVFELQDLWDIIYVKRPILFQKAVDLFTGKEFIDYYRDTLVEIEKVIKEGE